jgi:hypothetical protein
MRAYRVFWLFFCGVLGTLGTAVAFTWSLSTIILLFVCAFLTGGVVAMVLDADDDTRLLRDSRRIVARSAILTGSGTVAFVGVGTMVGGPMAVLLLAIMAGGSPYAIGYCLGWLREHGHLPSPSPRSDQPDPAERSSGSAPAPITLTEPSQPSEPPYAAPASLSDDALCLAWRASFSALQRASSPAQRMWVVEQRRAYLDELERRNARGVAAWLASGARAAGDPSRFVLGDSVPGDRPIDWDNLIHGTDN